MYMRIIHEYRLMSLFMPIATNFRDDPSMSVVGEARSCNRRENDHIKTKRARSREKNDPLGWPAKNR